MHLLVIIDDRMLLERILENINKNIPYPLCERIEGKMCAFNVLSKDYNNERTNEKQYFMFSDINKIKNIQNESNQESNEINVQNYAKKLQSNISGV